jgi:hypothetical protein
MKTKILITVSIFLFLFSCGNREGEEALNDMINHTHKLKNLLSDFQHDIENNKKSTDLKRHIDAIKKWSEEYVIGRAKIIAFDENGELDQRYIEFRHIFNQDFNNKVNKLIRTIEDKKDQDLIDQFQIFIKNISGKRL